MAALRIAIVNDFEVVVKGTNEMLRAYSDRVEVVELDADRRISQDVDIALYDSYARAGADIEDLGELLSNPNVGKVVVYSWNTHPSAVRGALEAGASGYLAKHLAAYEIVDELQAIHSGQVRAPDSNVNTSVPVGGDWPGREEGLTLRESEILALIAQGLSNEEIASQTYLSINSIKTYVRRAYQRIGVRDRSNAIIWAVRHGFESDHYRARNP